MAMTDAARLGLATLRRLPPRPAARCCAPAPCRPASCTSALGAFHRAHQAVYTEAAVGAAGGDWGIVGVAPRSTDVVDALAAQDSLFSVTTLAADGARHPGGRRAGRGTARRERPGRRGRRCSPTRRSGWSR